MESLDTLKIIIIEDDLAHAKLIIKNLRRAGVDNELIHLDNGQKGLDYFNSINTKNNQFLILLDLNLPIITGYEIIEHLRKDDKTHNIPIIVLTTTDNEEEIERCYALGANLYLTKPIIFSDFAEAMKKLGLMLSIIKVPQSFLNGGNSVE